MKKVKGFKCGALGGRIVTGAAKRQSVRMKGSTGACPARAVLDGAAAEFVPKVIAPPRWQPRCPRSSRPLDRWLCVPVFRRVCPINEVAVSACLYCESSGNFRSWDDVSHWRPCDFLKFNALSRTAACAPPHGEPDV